MTELLPCPFCGGKPRIFGCVIVNGNYWCMVSHSEEDHTVQVNATGKTEEEARQKAIEKWNRRTYE